MTEKRLEILIKICEPPPYQAGEKSCFTLGDIANFIKDGHDVVIYDGTAGRTSPADLTPVFLERENVDESEN